MAYCSIKHYLWSCDLSIEHYGYVIFRSIRHHATDCSIKHYSWLCEFVFHKILLIWLTVPQSITYHHSLYVSTKHYLWSYALPSVRYYLLSCDLLFPGTLPVIIWLTVHKTLLTVRRFFYLTILPVTKYFLLGQNTNKMQSMLSLPQVLSFSMCISWYFSSIP